MHSLVATVSDIAKEAGDLITDYYTSKEFSIATKSHQYDYVTSADTAADHLITRRLNKLSVGKTVLSEEGEQFPESFAGDVRIVDPIDGTYSFVHGNDMFSVMIGLARDGQPVLGVVHLPILDKTYMAHLGGGAYLQEGNQEPVPINVSETSDIKQAKIRISGSIYRRGLTDHIKRWKAYCGSLEQNRGRNRFGDLLEGKIDAYLYPLPISGLWDVCAPTAIIKEAEGDVTQHNGKPIAFSSDQHTMSMVVTNGKIHNSVLAMLSSFHD